MKKTTDYLNEAKKALNLDSDYKMSKWLGITTGALCNYQAGKRTIDDYTASRIAEALGIDALEVIAAANAEREKDEKRRAYWRQVGEKVAGMALIAAFFSFDYNGLEWDKNSFNLGYVKWRKAWKRLAEKLQNHTRRHSNEESQAVEGRQKVRLSPA